MFRALLCPSSGTRDYDVDYHVGRFALGLLYVAGCVRLGWSSVRAVSRTLHILSAFAKLRRAIITVVMSVCLSFCPSAWNKSVSTSRIFIEFFKLERKRNLIQI